MADSISFEVVTPEGLKFQDDVYQVNLPTPQGYIGVLPNHVPLITIVTPGVIVIHKHRDQSYEDTERLATAGGFVDIDGKRARLLADTAERAEEIDEAAAQTALARAKELRQGAKDVMTLQEATRFIEQETARLKTLSFKRRWKESTSAKQ